MFKNVFLSCIQELNAFDLHINKNTKGINSVLVNILHYLSGNGEFILNKS